MRARIVALLVVLLGASFGSARAGAEERWAGYLDYAYVYSSADPAALGERLAQYGREAGIDLDAYILRQFEAPPSEDGPLGEAQTRRKAIAYLLRYLASANPDDLDASVDAIRELEDRLERHENRYWYHYILAHQALEKGRRFDFVGELLDLWLKVVVPLENPYEALQTLSLDDAPNSGFAGALPFVYENIARIILIRSQEMGVDRDLDPLAALIRLLHDGRVGAYPDVIPPEASSRAYLDRIVERLDGPESDGGSLTFTLALFEASKAHDRARGLLAREGLSENTLKAIRLATGAYQKAVERADTEQGRCAVYTRVLRQLGELYAARQRLGVDPEVESPFGIGDAIDVYRRLHAGLDAGWEDLGYARNGKQAYVAAMRGLWEEIQEATLNIAEYYLARAVEAPHRADEYSRNAARLYTRYLSLFYEFATQEGQRGIPDSAYFAAHEAAKGVGDAFLAYAAHPRSEEIELATRRYRAALTIFPFDRSVWSALTAALERQGRESQYIDLVRPAAEAVTRSRAVEAWIAGDEPGAQRIAVLRRAFSDSLALMYLGFAEASGVAELEGSLEQLRAERSEVGTRLESLVAQRDGPGQVSAPAAMPDAAAEAGNEPAESALDAAELSRLNREIAAARSLLERLDRQIEARARTLPLYRATLETDGFADELRARRDHPLHTLLRRMYYEEQAPS